MWINKRKLIGLLVGLVCLTIAVVKTDFLIPSETGITSGPGYYSIIPGFDSDQLNSRMLVNQTFQLSPNDSLPQLLPAIRRRFRPNSSPNVVAHGNAAYIPVGWAFVKLLNTTDRPQTLMLSMPQYRCNQATLFVGRGNRFDSVGTLRNTTPLGNRFFPSLNLAFPISLPPRATLPLLLRTESRVGFHEVDLQLARQDVYFRTAFIDSIRDGSQVIICFIVALTALLIGWQSVNWLMLSYGGYLFSLSLAFCCQFGYLSFLPYPDWSSINADTLGTLFRLGIGMTVHPFLYEVVKPALRNRQRYKQWVIGYCLIRAAFMALHLMPYHFYGFVNYSTNMAMTYLDLINVGWVAYISVLAYWRARIWSLLVICLMMFVPQVFSQLFFFVQASQGQSSFRTPATHPLLIIMVLSFLTFEQFRKQLVTRRLLQARVTRMQADVNALRRQEIDGIGRYLHDQVGNTLAAALGYLGRLPTDAEKLRHLILNAINELRFMSHNLVKDDEHQLTDKVYSLVSRFNDFAPMHLSFGDYTNQQIDQLSAHKQQNIYSIIQELLTNIVRHSQATQVHVQFFCDGDTVDISVEDDGIGFDLSTARSATGIGIDNIYKRGLLSNIKVHFDPTPSGTTVLLRTLLKEATEINSP